MGLQVRSAIIEENIIKQEVIESPNQDKDILIVTQKGDHHQSHKEFLNPSINSSSNINEEQSEMNQQQTLNVVNVDLLKTSPETLEGNQSNKYVCKICNEDFNRKTQLEVHELVHNFKMSEVLNTSDEQGPNFKTKPNEISNPSHSLPSNINDKTNQQEQSSNITIENLLKTSPTTLEDNQNNKYVHEQFNDFIKGKAYNISKEKGPDFTESTENCLNKEEGHIEDSTKPNQLSNLSFSSSSIINNDKFEMNQQQPSSADYDYLFKTSLKILEDNQKKKYVSEICNVEFSRKSNMEVHKKIHESKKSSDNSSDNSGEDDLDFMDTNVNFSREEEDHIKDSRQTKESPKKTNISNDALISSDLLRNLLTTDKYVNKDYNNSVHLNSDFIDTIEIISDEEEDIDDSYQTKKRKLTGKKENNSNSIASK